ncbi:MAG: retropepsin-like aspartic protease [Patescibacteria group bacterium]
MKFPYARYGPFLRPVIPIKFIHIEQSFPYQVLIDTGADVSIVHAEIADQLSLELKSGKEYPFGGITGSGMGYIHHISVDIGGLIFEKVPIVFSNDISPRGHGILGHEGLFDKMRLVFELGKKQIEIVPKDYRKK